MERKLAAILCADVYGYSRLMGEDEEATLGTLTSHRKLIDSQIENHHGRFVNSAGDSVTRRVRQRGRGGEIIRVQGSSSGSPCPPLDGSGRS
jgi:class 3 adenylate cyclase